MGFNNITLYDFDKVEEHNLPNQNYEICDVGKFKVDAIAEKMKKYNDEGIDVTKKIEECNAKSNLEGIVFLLTDTMKSRKEIYDRAIKNNPSIDLLIETRMDLRGGRIYVVDPKDREQTKMYEQTFYSDDEAEVSACGVSQTVLPSALAITSHAIWKLLNHINGEIVYNETILDFSNEIVMTQKWGE